MSEPLVTAGAPPVHDRPPGRVRDPVTAGEPLGESSAGCGGASVKLRSMVEYADFYVLVATLSPLFLTGSLVAHYRFGLAESDPRARRGTWLLLGMNVGLTVAFMAVSLLVLAGSFVVHPPGRVAMTIALAIQLVISAGFAIWEARTKK
ncbi:MULTISPECIES: hypothetical protein [unclassified Geodermatophilus]|uniref:hypothetical protein n=1 Tax=unclassified Geodermatophilus TaxID=2637632 RepID=UPI003EEB45A5